MEMKPRISPKKGANPKLAILVVFGWFAGLSHGAYCASLTPNVKSFVALAGWAKENAFRFAGVMPDESLSLRSAAWTLRLKGDSQLAEINGVKVWLNQPVELRDSQLRVSALDLRTTLQPILLPEANSTDPPTVVHTICLDPGHGGKDPGEKAGSTLEKTYTLLLAKELAGRLRATGFRVVLTRTTDAFVGLDDRPALANRTASDLFISLHFNAAPAGECRGVEVYCLTPPEASSTNIGSGKANRASMPGNRLNSRNVLLAYQLQASLVKRLGVEDRGLRRARFAVLRPAKMPAALIEGGFLSDAAERQNITTRKYRSRMARAIVQGVLAYMRAVGS